MSRFASSAASAGLGLALAGVAFGARGGGDLARVSTVEVALILAGGLIIAAALAFGPRGRVPGATAVAMFAVLVVVTGASIVWSVAPDLSWIETNRTLTYFFVFAGGLAAARLAPDGWVILLRALLVAGAIILLYGLLSRVFPGELAATEQSARIGQPFGYWNALGAVAAMMLPLVLWLGARRSGHEPANALAHPLAAVVVLVLVLSFSRGALLVAILIALAWFAVVPLRLRSLAVLGVGILGALPILLWALSKRTFTEDRLPIEVRESIATEFGVLVVGVLVLTLVAGLLLGFRSAVRPPSAEARRRVGIAAVALAVLVPVAGLIALAGSEEGIGGTLDARVNDVLDESAPVSTGPERLTQTGTSRTVYYRQAGEIFVDFPETGTGAGTYEISRLRVREDRAVTRHAHGYVPQTMADLGAAGLVASTLLLLAWLVAAARTTSLHPFARWRKQSGDLPPPEHDATRVGVIALTLSAVAFGLHSLIDWTWFIPGPAVMAIATAGFVAGWRPLRHPEPIPSGGTVVASRAAEPLAPAPAAAPATPAPVPAATAAAAPSATATATAPEAGRSTQGGPLWLAPPPTNGGGNGSDATTVLPPPAVAPAPTAPEPRRRRVAFFPAFPRRRRAAGPPPVGPTRPPGADQVIRFGLAFFAIAVSALSAWTVLQPARAEARVDEAYQLLEAGRVPEAAAVAREAGRINPLSPAPLYAQAQAAARAGRIQEAEALLERAVRENPARPDTWLRLGVFQKDRLNQPREALASLQSALRLDPYSRVSER